MNDFIDEIKKKYNLGETGRYPYGDKGELKSAVFQINLIKRNNYSVKK